MVQISFYDDGTGKFIKEWPNWTGVVPIVGDAVMLHSGDNNKEEHPYVVRIRAIDGTRPDKIKLFIKSIK